MLVLERDDVVGGAARSVEVFPGHDARLSEFAYLVSLLPQLIVDELGLDVALAPRRFSSYTPVGDGGILVDGSDPARTRADLGDDAEAWEALREMTTAVAERVFPTLTEPLRSADDLRRHVGDDDAWKALFERPLGELLEERFSSDMVRGIILTDALVGTFTSANDPSLLANRCYLYHVIGRGTGRWDVPVGGMGSVSQGLAAAARSRGAEHRDRRRGRRRRDRRRHRNGADRGWPHHRGPPGARQRGARSSSPASSAEPSPAPAPEGSQLKINMLLRRLPRLRDPRVTPEQAFCGTFHINEGYDQLERAYRQAVAGEVPELPPCEVYCHSLTDPSILSPALRDAGVQTLTLFGLHMPARLFARRPDRRSGGALVTRPSPRSTRCSPSRSRTASSIRRRSRRSDRWRSKPSWGCPAGTSSTATCSGRSPSGPKTSAAGASRPSHPNVFVCGAGARRGGGVSGIPGRNAARAALAADP